MESPGTAVRDGCTLPCKCWEANEGPLEGSQLLSTADLLNSQGFLHATPGLRQGKGASRHSALKGVEFAHDVALPGALISKASEISMGDDRAKEMSCWECQVLF